MTHTAAGPAVVAAVSDDVDRLLSAEPDVRQDLPDSVHQMRVATRRLRSVLRSYRRVFRRRPVDELRDELRWLAGLLGVARDAEVRAERFAALLEQHPELAKKKFRIGGKDAPARGLRKLLVTAERERYAAAHAEILTALDSERYRTLTAALRTLLDDPPLREAYAQRPAERFCRSVLRDDFHRVRRLVRLEPTLSEAERVEHLHDIRKAAKRLRYSADAAVPLLNGPAKSLSGNAKRLQTVLGDHRDAVEAEAAIRDRLHDSTNPAWQTLCEDEAAAARRSLEQYPATTEFLRKSFDG
ncbi:CHAD domain-containing protein [Nocardia otitidiscaviarum]|uniref:CHAD domain-containing protein n=1 Tax=Nocardia otitidiscaviarum TaxID=1823 RepID=A0A516NI08_9NOCA|nr:CHAD domain-containing protein [Nocardia otitidiscaviarum]MCP9619998.1 CHAD domain-containing protein [Nocardia otitidiscaviarum]QDP78532.1 CHAD domain-containing protein [Nocardia otitidiscaviarum]